MEITRGIVPSAQKVVIYGPEGIGKSTFAAQFPNPVFIDTEDSTKHMDVARTPKPSSWTMLLGQVRHFRDNPGQCSTLVIDTADWAERLCVEHVCAKSQPPKNGIEDFGFGKGYVYLAEEFGRLLNILEEVVGRGIHVVLTAHAQMRKFEQPEEMGSYDRWEMKLGKKTAPLVKEWADMVLFAKYKIHVVNVDGQGAQKGKNKAQGGQRVMMTSHTPSWDAKNRHGLKEELPFAYSEIAHCFLIDNAGGVSPVDAALAEDFIRRAKERDEAATMASAQAEQSAPPPIAPASAPAQLPDTQQMELSPSPEPQKYTGPFPPTDEQPIRPQPPLDPAIPQALRDLMEKDLVTELELQEAVAKRGYYPVDTPIRNYQPEFIQGALVAAWPQLLEFIEKKVRDLPF